MERRSQRLLVWITYAVAISVMVICTHMTSQAFEEWQNYSTRRPDPQNAHNLNLLIKGAEGNSVNNAGGNDTHLTSITESKETDDAAQDHKDDLLPWWDGGDCILGSEGQWKPRHPSLEDSIPRKIIYEGGTCGRRATADGNHQRIITFSLFGDNPGYWMGLDETLSKVKSLYPGWKVWLYTNPRGRSGILCPLMQDHPNLRVCDATNLPFPLYNISEVSPRMWRMAALGDDNVDVMIVRDTDARFTEREQSAVQDWLSTGEMFHVMRDHPAHTVHVLAGMWGARWDVPSSGSATSLKSLPPRPVSSADLRKIRNKMLQMAFRHPAPDVDQFLLRRELWPEMANYVVAHDSFLCRKFKNGVRPWPTKRPYNTFVGNANYRVKFSHSIFNETCPKECRPPEHPDWWSC